MNIYGLNKTTLLDYPGRVASTVFTGRCNFLCPFCHNSDLVLHPDAFPLITEEEVFNHLTKRHNVLTGVCITGGEPTLQEDLIPFIRRIKEIGYAVKLDTNGYNPDILQTIVDEKIIDYIAMDIKAGFTHYAKATGVANINLQLIKRSVDIMSTSGLEHEFRTTVVKGIHTESDFEEIATILPSDSNYYLQSFKYNDCITDKSLDSFSREELEHFADIVRTKIPNVSLRGVD